MNTRQAPYPPLCCRSGPKLNFSELAIVWDHKKILSAIWNETSWLEFHFGHNRSNLHRQLVIIYYNVFMGAILFLPSCPFPSASCCCCDDEELWADQAVMLKQTQLWHLSFFLWRMHLILWNLHTPGGSTAIKNCPRCGLQTAELADQLLTYVCTFILLVNRLTFWVISDCQGVRNF